MTTIVYQKDKRIGVTYVYESTSFWDKEKKQSRAKRKLIGKVDPETGQVVPTDGRGRNKKAPQAVSRSFCGATELFDVIGDKMTTEVLTPLFSEISERLRFLVEQVKSLESAVQKVSAERDALKAEVEKLKVRLNRNASNSSKPPSSDSPSC